MVDQTIKAKMKAVSSSNRYEKNSNGYKNFVSLKQNEKLVKIKISDFDAVCMDKKNGNFIDLFLLY